jgi:hypothetical protein
LIAGKGLSFDMAMACQEKPGVIKFRQRLQSMLDGGGVVV